MKNIGEAKKVLSIEIERDRKGEKVCLTQKEYLQKILQKFSINDDTKSVSKLLTAHFKLKTTMSPTTAERVSICLMYPM